MEAPCFGLLISPFKFCYLLRPSHFLKDLLCLFEFLFDGNALQPPTHLVFFWVHLTVKPRGNTTCNRFALIYVAFADLLESELELVPIHETAPMKCLLYYKWTLNRVIQQEQNFFRELFLLLAGAKATCFCAGKFLRHLYFPVTVKKYRSGQSAL